MKKSDDSRYQIQALAKGLRVLGCFHDTDEYGITELSQIVNLPESTIQRIVNTLEFAGNLYQNITNKKYRLSPKVLQTNNRGANFLKWKEQALIHMVDLNKKFGENVNLAVRDQDKCLYIELVESKYVLRPNFTFEDTYPLYCTSLGRSLMCDLPENLIYALLPDKIEPMTPYSITDKKKIIEIVREIKVKKYAFENEEFNLELCCVGGPIFGVGNTVVAAISVTAPTTRMPKVKIQKLIPAVVITAELISNEFKQIFGS